MQQNKIVSDPASWGWDNTQVVANQETQITQANQQYEATINIQNYTEATKEEAHAISIKQDALIAGQEAIEAKQDQQISHMETSLANETEIKENQISQLNEQVDLKDLVWALFELVARLDFLPMVKWVSADIRVTPLSTPNMATLSTLTTCGTLTNQQQMWGFWSNQQIPSLVNMTAQTNINNIVVS